MLCIRFLFCRALKNSKSGYVNFYLKIQVGFGSFCLDRRRIFDVFLKDTLAVLHLFSLRMEP